MAIRLIRQESDTPNVSNTDDARMARYAYGGRDGVVKGYGQECAYTVNGKTFSVGSGCIVLQGWEVLLDANGWSITMSTASVARNFLVYLEINLATQTAAINTVYTTGTTTPVINSGDDLTNNTTGTARLSLYRFTVDSSGVIIDGTNIALNNVRTCFSVLDYDPTVDVKKSIEELSVRLEEQGFKQATVEDGGIALNSDWTVAVTEGSIVNGEIVYTQTFPQGVIMKSGKLCLLKILQCATESKENFEVETSTGKIRLQGIITTLDSSFAPKEKQVFNCDFFAIAYDSTVGKNIQGSAKGTFTIGTDGIVSFNGSISDTEYSSIPEETYLGKIWMSMCGYEI
ncbi:MAG: hypothetical protein IJX91_04635 [Clostridia bacterium]|nr:hypothetical protein [Clostridia bacterium]